MLPLARLTQGLEDRATVSDVILTLTLTQIQGLEDRVTAADDIEGAVAALSIARLLHLP